MGKPPSTSMLQECKDRLDEVKAMLGAQSHASIAGRKGTLLTSASVSHGNRGS